ncbi:hypothetical protein ACWDE9_29150, partial [Streptomyces olivaceoviridis]
TTVRSPSRYAETVRRRRALLRTSIALAPASAVLGYRLLTVWLPLLPGLLVLGVLVRRKAL